MSHEYAASEPTENLSAKVEQMQAQITSQMRQLQIAHELLGYRPMTRMHLVDQVNAMGPGLAMESQFVQRVEFEKLMKVVVDGFNALELELKQLRLEYESCKFTMIEKRVLDLEEREKTRRELERLREATVRAGIPQLAGNTAAANSDGPKKRFTEQFREMIGNEKYNSDQEKRYVLDLLDDQLRWLGGEKSSVIEDLKDDGLTEEFLKYPDLVKKYHESLPALFADVTPSTPMVSTECSEDESDDTDIDDKNAGHKRQRRAAHEEDYDGTEGDDSMVM